MPVEPPSSAWRFPSVEEADEQGLVGMGADLEPGTLLQAYRQGLFPMPVTARGALAWWSPDPRGVVPLEGFRQRRSLRRARHRYEIRVDTAFAEVIEGCADPGRPGGWISAEIREAYSALYRLGWAHSVEAWDADGLAGGLYGLAVSGLFAGESMFHRRTDASKAALMGLVELLQADGDNRRLLDVQWTTEHLASLGAVDVPRVRYLQLLATARTAPLPAIWA